MKRLILRSFLSPGDVLMLTAAVRDLHRAYPDQFETDVRTSINAIWTNNPNITRLREGEPATQKLDMHYPLVHQSCERPYHFIHGHVQHLEQQLDLQIPVTQHLKYYHPDWAIDVAALIGKESAFHGLCRQVFVLDREELRGHYDLTLDLNWEECNTCFAYCPSTKAERCLQEIFDLTALPELCTYKCRRGEKATQSARAYLAQICTGKWSGNVEG